MFDISIGLAFFAGIISFVSPCVLPLVPAYIGYMGGRMTTTVAAQVQAGADGAALARPSLLMRFNTLLHGLMFVLGFTLVFVLLGVVTTAFIQQFGGQNVNQITNMLGRIGGIVIIAFGLHFMGALQPILNRISAVQSESRARLIALGLLAGGIVLIAWGMTGTLALWDERLWVDFTGQTAQTVWAPMIAIILVAMLAAWMFVSGAFSHPRAFLGRVTGGLNTAFYADTRRQMTGGSAGKAGEGLLGSLFMGVVFSAGWTPCIGPVYGAILTMSATTGDVSQAIPLLTAYSLGLGIPFLLAAIMLDGAQGVVRRMNRRMRTIKLVSGAFLILIGLAVASGQLQNLSQQLGAEFTDLSIRVEECSIGWIQGEIGFGQLGDCLSGAVEFDALREANVTAHLTLTL
ncbi:MAG TPA: cytochrome c biogenesis protein CcdA [Aggregatilineales bacterium]|nr:cytochrome c biogenesis protein CcdA [Aggregatilineales bacterium]